MSKLPGLVENLAMAMRLPPGTKRQNAFTDAIVALAHECHLVSDAKGTDYRMLLRRSLRQATRSAEDPQRSN